MKRAVLILFAALLVLLVYPSTHPYAKSSAPGNFNQPTVITPKDHGDPIAYSDDSDGDSDGGDSDDVAGWRDGGGGALTRSGSGGALAPTELGLMFKMWWNFMIWIR
jgi:hypothetical protein